MLLSVALIALLQAAPAAVDPSLNFIVMGDWGHNSEGQKATAAAMLTVANRDNSQFVLALGDNLYN
jgi:hypothetical protein